MIQEEKDPARVYESLRRDLPRLLEKSKVIGEEYVDKAKAKALNSFEIDMLVEDKFET